MTDASNIQTEMTPDGEQVLVAGVRPVTERDGVMWRANQPIAPKRNPHAQQKCCDIGLFDEAARSQLDMLDFIRATESGAANRPQPKE